MSKSALFGKRFSELMHQADVLAATKTKKEYHFGWDDGIDDEIYIGWKIKVLNLLEKACGSDSIHLKSFNDAAHGSLYSTNYETFKRTRAVFVAAMEDYEGGYIVGIRSLIQAEVFGSELDQARELLSSGYHSAAAVVAGVVLETTLRQMCSDASPSIPHGKLDKMNADLTKAGIYNVLVQKRITALADVRNSAAHGHPEKFKPDDVKDMIAYIESFVSERV